MYDNELLPFWMNRKYRNWRYYLVIKDVIKAIINFIIIYVYIKPLVNITNIYCFKHQLL